MRVSAGLLLMTLALGGCGASERSGLPTFPSSAGTTSSTTSPPGVFPTSGPVRVPQDFKTLQEAVRVASSGDTILVGSGTYDGQVSITKQLTILGQGQPVLTNALSNTTLLLQDGAAGTVLSGFAIEGTGRVVQVSGNQTELTNLRLENLTIRANGTNSTGMVLDNTPGAIVSNISVDASFTGLQIGQLKTTPDVRAREVHVRIAEGALGFQLLKCPRLLLEDSSVDPLRLGQSFRSEAQGITLQGELDAKGLNLTESPAVPDVRLERVRVDVPGAQISMVAVNAGGLVLRDCTFRSGAFEAIDLAKQGSPIIITTSTDYLAEGIRLERTRVLAATATVPTLATITGYTKDFQVLNCTFKGGVVGLVARDRLDEQNQSTALGLHRSFQVRDTSFLEQSQSGLVLALQQDPEVSRCYFEGQGDPIRLAVCRGLTVRNCIMRGSSIAFNVLIGPCTARLLNNVFAYNFGVVLATLDTELDVRNNILYRNQNTFAGNVTGDYNDFFENEAGEVPIGDHDVNVNPQFADESRFMLQAGARIIDRGDPGSEFNDAIPPGQGTVRNDMGAYGGPAAGNTIGAQP